MRQGETQLHILADHPPQHFLEVFDQIVGVQHHGLEHLLAAEREQLPGEPGGPLRGFPHFGNVRLQRAVGREILAHEIGVPEDRGQHVVEVVRDAARQAADGLHLLRLAQLLLEALALGDVLADAERAGGPALRVPPHVVVPRDQPLLALLGHDRVLVVGVGFALDQLAEHAL